MRLRSLSELRRAAAQETVVATLPQRIAMSHYAREKAFKINELVRLIHKDSYEWYGFTIGNRQEAAVVVDIGLPRNQYNLFDYTSIDAEGISEFQESLDRSMVINGWIHSHGRLEYRQFSKIDERNQLTVLDYVSSLLRKPVAKKEVLIKDLTLLVKGRYQEEDLKKGSVTIVTDSPVKEARILETIYGGFCYSIVIGDEGWHQQDIYYQRIGILSGQKSLERSQAEIALVDTGRSLSEGEVGVLAEQVRENIKPVTSPLPEMIERM